MTALPDFEGWAIFAKVAELGSFAGAASELGLSQPTISKCIAKLERRVGVTLVQRTSRQLLLTSAGEAALAQARELLERGARLEAEVAEQAMVPRGRVRVAAPMSFGVSYLAPLIPDFLAQYPEIDVELSLSDHLVDVVADRFDMALRIASLADSSLRARRLCTVRRPLVASPAYLDRYGRPTHPRDLEAHECMIYSNLPNPTQWRFRHVCGEEHTVPVKGRVFINNAEGLEPALLAGFGLALQPEFLVWEQLAKGELEEVLPDWSIDEIALHLITPPSALRPLRVTVLMDYFARCLAIAPWATKSDRLLVSLQQEAVG